MSGSGLSPPPALPAGRYRMLVLDDDESYRARLVRAFTRRGFLAVGAATGAQALAQARSTPFDLAVIDLRLPDQSGLAVLRELKFITPSLAIAVVTGYGSIATAISALKLGAVHYVAKPAEVDDILAVFQDRLGPVVAAPPSAEVPSLARVEWEHINRVLVQCGGNVSQAARLLGLPRRSLQRKLAKHPVTR